MKKILFILLIALGACQPQQNQPEKQAVDYVNPFIGTGGEMGVGFGNMFPGATYPFGMIQLSPDNGGQNWMYCGGYRYADSMIVGFSHTHFSGTGVADFCDISVMPTNKPIEEKFFVQEDEVINQIIAEENLDPNGFCMSNGEPGEFDKNFLLKYRSRFSHDKEEASAGYYSVTLEDDDIDVELTTGDLVAMHRYRFNQAEKPQHVILNLGFRNTDRVTGARVRHRSDNLITGYRFSSGKASVQRVFFAMQFSRKLDDYKFFNTEDRDGKHSAEGKELAAAFSFDPKEGKELLVKVSISSVSEENALANLQTGESIAWDFDGLCQATKEKWNKELSKIAVKSDDEEKKTIFYTSLYHSYVAPYRFSDTDGRYKGFNHEPVKAEGYTHYHLLSLWDTFRALNPLLTMMQPQVEIDIIHSMIAKFRQTGELPYWEVSGNEGGSMIGYHAAVLMAEAVLKGVGEYDVEEMFRAMVDASERDRKGLGFYQEYGFVPTDKEKSGTVSKTLEYAYDDWCIAQVAKHLGKQEEYERYMKRSQYYKNLFDPAYRLFRGKNSDGSWYEPFHPRFAQYGNAHCVEGNTWQYSFFAPHDMEGLIDMMGGDSGFEMMLDSLFTQSSELLGKWTEDVTGMIGQYAHGNEPSHHAAYLYNYIGKPKKTQFYTNKVINTLYKNSPDGLCGNEDCGQMSAWYVYSAMGFYPVNPVDGIYQIGSPQFEEVKMSLPNGNTFLIKANNVSAENIYIQSATLNGKKLDRYDITWDEIQDGSTLVFEMTSDPS